MISAPVYCRTFIGREEQLAALRDRFQACCSGEGNIALLAGDAGMGKSRLVAEFCRELQTQNVALAITGCLEYVQSPFAPFASALQSFWESDRQALTAVRGADAALQRLLPKATLPANQDEQIDKIFVFDTVARMLEALGEKRPAVVAIDDLHWADAGSLELLQFLASRISGSRVLVIATYRPDEVRTAHALRGALSRIDRSPCVWRILLEPLDDTHMNVLLHHALEGRTLPSPQIIEAIKAEAEGNPLDAEELLKSAVESAVLHPGAPVALPGSLTESVLERLSPLNESDRSILLYASAIGRQFDPELLTQILQKPLSEIFGALRKAIELQLIVEQAANGEIRYAFRHALTRAAIYNQLLAVESRPLHAKIAAAMEAGDDRERRVPELAYHYWQARDLQKAAEYNEIAGDAATAVCAFNDAAVSYDRALEAASSLEMPSTDLEKKLADALRESGEGARARKLYEHVLEQYEKDGSVDAAVAVCSALRILCYDLGDTQSVLTFAERAVELAKSAGPVLQFKALVGLANVLVNWNAPERVLATLDQAKNLVQTMPAGPDAHYYYVLGALHLALDEPDESAAAFHEALRLALACKNWYQATIFLVNYARAAASLGLRDESIAALEQYLRIVRTEKIGLHNHVSTLVRCGFSYAELGMLPQARAIVEEALTLPVAEAGLALLIRAGATQVGLRIEDDDLLRRAANADFMEAALGVSGGHFSAFAAEAASDLLRAQGNLQEAQALLHRVMSLPRDYNGTNEIGRLCVRVGEYGDPADIPAAREHLRGLLEKGNRRCERAKVELFEAYAAKRNGDKESAAAHAARSESLYAELQLPAERARSLELMDRRAEALELYRQIGEIREIRRLEKALTPVNRRGRPKTELTNREREIAALVARGASNSSIAEELIISERTVESHVAAIFDKLGINTRAEIATYVATHAAPAG